jgi:hypothetical protein
MVDALLDTLLSRDSLLTSTVELLDGMLLRNLMELFRDFVRIGYVNPETWMRENKSYSRRLLLAKESKGERRLFDQEPRCHSDLCNSTWRFIRALPDSRDVTHS